MDRFFSSGENPANGIIRMTREMKAGRFMRLEQEMEVGEKGQTSVVTSDDELLNGITLYPYGVRSKTGKRGFIPGVGAGRSLETRRSGKSGWFLRSSK